MALPTVDSIVAVRQVKVTARALAPATDLLVLFSRVQVQLSVRPHALGH